MQATDRTPIPRKRSPQVWHPLLHCRDGRASPPMFRALCRQGEAPGPRRERWNVRERDNFHCSSWASNLSPLYLSPLQAGNAIRKLGRLARAHRMGGTAMLPASPPGTRTARNTVAGAVHVAQEKGGGPACYPPRTPRPWARAPARAAAPWAAEGLKDAQFPHSHGTARCPLGHVSKQGTGHRMDGQCRNPAPPVTPWQWGQALSCLLLSPLCFAPIRAQLRWPRVSFKLRGTGAPKMKVHVTTGRAFQGHGMTT